MCYNTYLHRNEHGCVSECGKCGRFQVTFGNILLTVTQKEFFFISKAAQKFYFEKENHIERHVKSVYLQTPSRNVSIALSVDELEQFTDLLQASLIAFELNRIFLPEHN